MPAPVDLRVRDEALQYLQAVPTPVYCCLSAAQRDLTGGGRHLFPGHRRATGVISTLPPASSRPHLVHRSLVRETTATRQYFGYLAMCDAMPALLRGGFVLVRFPPVTTGCGQKWSSTTPHRAHSAGCYVMR